MSKTRAARFARISLIAGAVALGEMGGALFRVTWWSGLAWACVFFIAAACFDYWSYTK